MSRYPWLPVGVLVAVGWLVLLWGQQLAFGLVHFPSRAVVLPPSARLTADPLTRQVVLVVVPGLTVGDVVAMPAWQRLAEQGATGTLQTVLPSFTWPNEAALVTGAPPWLTGVLTDLHAETVAAEPLFARVPTAVVGSYVWDRLFPGQVARSAVLPAGEGRLERALHWIKEGFPLVVVEVDRSLADAQILALSQALDLRGSTLVVVSPRGRTAQGGMGGSEPPVARVPFLMVGAGVAPASGLRGKMLDLAPTLASLLGVPPPAHNLGKPVGVRFSAELLEAQQRRLADGSLSMLGVENPVSPDPVRDLVVSVQRHEGRARAVRLVGWAVFLGLVAWWLARLDRRRGWRAVLVGLQWGALVALSWNLAYLVLVGPYSPSRVASWDEARVMGLFCGLLGFLLVLVASGLRGFGASLRTGGLEVAVGTVLIMGGEALLFGALYGFPRPVSVPRADLTLALAALLAGLIGVCLAAPLTPWISRLASRWPVRKGRVGKVVG